MKNGLIVTGLLAALATNAAANQNFSELEAKMNSASELQADANTDFAKYMEANFRNSSAITASKNYAATVIVDAALLKLSGKLYSSMQGQKARMISLDAQIRAEAAKVTDEDLDKQIQAIRNNINSYTATTGPDGSPSMTIKEEAIKEMGVLEAQKETAASDSARNAKVARLTRELDKVKYSTLRKAGVAAARGWNFVIIAGQIAVVADLGTASYIFIATQQDPTALPVLSATADSIATRAGVENAVNALMDFSNKVASTRR